METGRRAVREAPKRRAWFYAPAHGTCRMSHPHIPAPLNAARDHRTVQVYERGSELIRSEDPAQTLCERSIVCAEPEFPKVAQAP